MQKHVNHSVRRIHEIAKRMSAVNYLEIGVCTGETFLNVELPFKVAVDPAFRFDTAEHESSASRFFPVTSDAFFERLANDRGLFRAASNQSEHPETFDIIFLDGLHTYEQTARDFVNSLKYAHDKTVWILDDTIPCDPFSAVSSMDKSLEVGNALGVKHGLWHGDVFKVVVWLHDLYPQFSYCTIMDGGNPQTIVWRTAEAQERFNAFGDVKEIEKMDYFSMLEYADCFAPVLENDFMACLGQQISVLRSRSTDKELWKKLVYRKLIPALPRWKEAFIRFAACCIPVKAARKRLRKKWLEA